LQPHRFAIELRNCYYTAANQKNGKRCGGNTPAPKEQTDQKSACCYIKTLAATPFRNCEIATTLLPIKKMENAAAEILPHQKNRQTKNRTVAT